MKRISGILAIGVTALVLSSGRPISALEPQAPKTSKTPEKAATQVPDKSAVLQQRAQIIRCTVPDLVGQNVSAARGVLEKAHLSLGDVDRRPDSHSTGTIIGQSAKPGTPIKCGLTVDIVSAVFTEPQQPDPPVCQVRAPDLFNVDMRSAEKILGGQKLRLGDIETKTDARVKGTVIGQLPPRGTLVPCGTRINIVVAVPPPAPPPCPPIKVPSLIGQDQETGITLLARAGLRVGNIERVKSEEPTGTILRQSQPRAFGRCEASIDLVVAVQTRVSPPPAEPTCPTITVPSVIGRDQETGITLLARAGLRVGSIERVKSEEPTGTILRQSQPKALGKCEASIDLVVAVQTRVSPPPPPAEPICPTITVPSVIGRDQETGITLLVRAGLRVGNIERVKSDEPTGTILRQSAPKPLGKCDASIDLVLAEQTRVSPPPPTPPPPPPAPVVVPQLTGRLQADALDLIRNANLSSGTIRERQSSQTTGIVVEQRPAAGTPVPRGTSIDFVVAIPAPVAPVPVPQPIAPPPAPVVVPQLTGRLQADALDLIRNANLSSGTIRERQSSQTTGIVVEQRPAAGTPVPRGTSIDFVVAIPAPVTPIPVPQPIAPVTPVPVPQPIAPPPPPVKITVPDLRGSSQNDAAASIQGLKLLVGPIAERESAESRGIILEQDPQPGALVDAGTPISLWLAIPIAPVVQPTLPPPPPVLVAVPRVVEGSIEQALVAIRTAGLQPGTVTQTPSAVAAGIVTFQTPAAGVQVTPGTPVDLIVSVPLAQAEASELPLIWLVAGLVTGLVVAAAASLRRAPRNRLAGSPTLMPHADEGQQTSVPGDGSLVDFEVSLDPHPDGGVQMLEEKRGLIAGEWSGTQVMSW